MGSVIIDGAAETLPIHSWPTLRNRTLIDTIGGRSGRGGVLLSPLSLSVGDELSWWIFQVREDAQYEIWIIMEHSESSVTPIAEKPANLRVNSCDICHGILNSSDKVLDFFRLS